MRCIALLLLLSLCGVNGFAVHGIQQTGQLVHPKLPVKVFLHSSTNSDLNSDLITTPSTTTPVENELAVSRPKRIVWLGVSVVLAGLAIGRRQEIGAFLHFVKNEWLLTTMDRLNAAGPGGLVAYTLFFVLWEMTMGITTPLETAAGMAFGAPRGILANGIGKIVGAYATFVLSRYIFSAKVHEQVQSNELLSLMEESAQEEPLRVALLCRFAPLPEIVKNAGMGALPVPKRWFLVSLFLHGLSFTCLWTCMGAETARVLRGGPPSATLKLLTTGATWIGFGAPVGIGMWIKSLKAKQAERRRTKANGLALMEDAQSTIS